MEILCLVSEMSPYIRHTHTQIYVYFLCLTILIYMKTKSKVNGHPQIPAVPSVSLWNGGRVIYPRGETVYILGHMCPCSIKN